MGAKTRKLSQINDSLIEWQSVVVADGSTGLTAVAGRGYFINTTGGAITVTFPASPKIGDTIIINDYATNFATNNVTINFNGNKLEAETANAVLSTNDQTHTFVFTDATQGWKIVNQDTGAAIQPLFISATGGTVTTSGNFKIHSFTGDGCFAVTTVGNPTGGGSNVDYLVVAGGGGSGYYYGGGGGAGGFREGRQNAPDYTASPLVAPAGLPVSATTYPITVGAGGLSRPGCGPFGNEGTPGSNSVFSTITASGGGAGAGDDVNKRNGLSGGSGGGAGGAGPGGSGGAGNTPPTSPSQGNNGSSPGSPTSGGAGGGAGGNASGKVAGAGAYTSITASPVVYAGGGNGGPPAGGPYPTDDGRNAYDQSGTANTGQGAGADSGGPSPGVAKGGKGIVVIRYKFQ